MKTILGLLILLAAFGADAAVPALSDFNTNQFATNGSKVAIKSGAALTNTAFTGSLTLNGAAFTNNAGASDNWVANGTTNSQLFGIPSVNAIVVTNTITISSSGNQNTPRILGGGDNTGFAFRGGGNDTIGIISGGSAWFNFKGANLAGYSASRIGWATTSGGSGWAADPDAFFTRDTTATIQMGDDAATAVNQKLKAHDGSGTDKAGANLALSGGYGTGTGPGGDFITTGSVSSNATGSAAQFYSTRHFERAKPSVMTNSAACPVLRILCNTNDYTVVKLFATTFAHNGTDLQQFSEELKVGAVNKAGTLTLLVTPSWGTNTTVSTGTLTTTWTLSAAANSFDVFCTPVSSLTPTTYYTKWTADVLSNDPATITAY